MYPFNWPLSKAVARLGFPLAIKIDVVYDTEEHVYIATSPSIKGLFVEASTLDDIRKEVELVLPDLIEIQQGDASLVASRNACLQISTPLHAA